MCNFVQDPHFTGRINIIEHYNWFKILSNIFLKTSLFHNVLFFILREGKLLNKQSLILKICFSFIWNVWYCAFFCCLLIFPSLISVFLQKIKGLKSKKWAEMGKNDNSLRREVTLFHIPFFTSKVKDKSETSDTASKLQNSIFSRNALLHHFQNKPLYFES